MPMTDLDLDELDRLHAEAMKNPEGWSAGAKNECARRLKTFGLVMRKAYPALSARLRELENDYYKACNEMAKARGQAQEAASCRDWDRLIGMERAHEATGLFQQLYLKGKQTAEEVTSLRAELDAVKRERDEMELSWCKEREWRRGLATDLKIMGDLKVSASTILATVKGEKP